MPRSRPDSRPSLPINGLVALHPVTVIPPAWLDQAGEGGLPGTCLDRYRPGARTVTYLTAPDGSWAAMSDRPDYVWGGYQAREGGPTSLLAALERTWTAPAALGHPPMHEFGLTVARGSVQLWHGAPTPDRAGRPVTAPRREPDLPEPLHERAGTAVPRRPPWAGRELSGPR